MLGKLLKYEFKATGRTLLPLYGAVILLAFINKLFLGDFFVNTDTSLGSIPKVIGIMVYVTTLIGTFIATLFITIQRYRKNLLGDEGYLMNTIPVKPWLNIASKLIVACIWSVLSGIVAMISIFILAYEAGAFTSVINAIGQIFDEIINVTGTNGLIYAMEILFLMVISGIGGVLMIYASLSLGSLFAKRKVLASFGAYIVLSIASNTVASIFQVPTMMLIGMPTSPQAGDINMFLIVTLGISTLFAVVYFIICNFVLSKKLNLE